MAQRSYTDMPVGEVCSRIANRLCSTGFKGIYRIEDVLGVVWESVKRSQDEGVPPVMWTRRAYLRVIDEYRLGGGKRVKRRMQQVPFPAYLPERIQVRSDPLMWWCYYRHIRLSAGLTWRERVVLYLVTVELMTYKQTAQAMGMSLGGIEAVLLRCRNKINDVLNGT